MMALIVNSLQIQTICTQPLVHVRLTFWDKWEARIKLNVIEYLRREHLTPWDRTNYWDED